MWFYFAIAVLGWLSVLFAGIAKREPGISVASIVVLAGLVVVRTWECTQ